MHATLRVPAGCDHDAPGVPRERRTRACDEAVAPDAARGSKLAARPGMSHRSCWVYTSTCVTRAVRPCEAAGRSAPVALVNAMQRSPS